MSVLRTSGGLHLCHFVRLMLQLEMMCVAQLRQLVELLIRFLALVIAFILAT